MHDTFPVRHEEILSVDLSSIERFGAAELAKARVDGELLAAFLRDHPAEVTSIVNAVYEGRVHEARATAEAIGMTESEAQRRGGGMWAYILLAAGMIYAYAAFSEPKYVPPTASQ
jgi:hypothetical protein